MCLGVWLLVCLIIFWLKDNERADKAAKLAIVERRLSNISLPYKDLYSSIDMKVKAKALQTWINVSNNKLRNIKSCITPWSTSLHRNRCWEVILARLRLGHTRWVSDGKW